MLRYIKITIVLIILLTNCVLGQDVYKTKIGLRSIYERNNTEKAISKAKGDTAILNEYMLKNEKILLYKEQDDWKKINSYSYIYKIYGQIGNKEGQNRCVERIIRIGEKLNNMDIYLTLVIMRAEEATRQHDINKSFQIYFEAEKYLLQKKHYQQQLAIIYIKISQKYSKQLNQSMEIRYLMKAVEIASQVDNIELKAKVFYEIAKFYVREEEPDKSLNYLYIAREYFMQLDDEKNLAGSTVILATIYKQKNEFQTAILVFEKAIRILEKYKCNTYISKANTGIGECYEALGDNESALEYYQKALENCLQNDDIQELENTCIKLGIFYNKIGEKEKARNFLEESFKLEKKSQSSVENSSEAANLLSKLYYEKKDYKKAYYNARNAINYYTEEIDKNSGQEVARTEMEYLNNKEREYNYMVDRQQEEALKNSKKMFMISITLGSISILLFITTLILYTKQIKKNRQINSQKDEIAAQNEELQATKEELLEQTIALEKRNDELKKLSLVARETDNAIFITNLNGTIIWINKALADLVGWDSNIDIEEKHLSIFDVSKNPNIKNLYEQAKCTKHSVSYTTQTINKENQNVWLKTDLTPVFNEHNELYQYISLISNITNLKKAQEKIDEKNKEIQASINYAKKIQDSIKPMQIFLETVLPEFFIINMPKSTVSGDFFWVDYKRGRTIIAVADCTGHGIPGGFMSVLGQVTLSDIIASLDDFNASDILNLMRIRNIKLLHQRGKIGETQDGMDLSLCIIDNKEKTLNYAGAYSFTYMVREGEPNAEEIKLEEKQRIRIMKNEETNNHIIYFKPDRMPIGIHSKDDIPFRDLKIKLNKGDKIYMTTDGMGDQFGGPHYKKLHTANVEKMILSFSNLPINEQEKQIKNYITTWKGDNEQMDDILMIGLKI